MDAPQRIKIISFGDALVGKSCIIKRYCELVKKIPSFKTVGVTTIFCRSKFVSKHIPTIGVDYGVKSAVVKGAEVRC